MNKFNINIDQDRIWYIVTYIGIIALFVLLGIFPLYHYNANLLDKNKELKNQIEDQKELKPVYLNLLKTLNNKDLLILPNPEKKTISREEAGRFQDDIRTIALHAGLKNVSVTPDLSTLAGSSTSLLHNVVLKGEFANFRQILIGLGAVPYLDRIEEISIMQNPDSMEFRMKIWIALK
jgi:Tfp pilus assembly protein PilO